MGFSPFELLFGYPPRVPIDNLIIPSQHALVSTLEMFQKLANRLHKIWAIAQQFSDKCAAKTKERYDSKSCTLNFRDGDLVLRRIERSEEGLSRKLSPYWDGPHRVVYAPIQASTVILRLFDDAEGKYDKISVNRLKPYTDRANSHTVMLCDNPACYSILQVPTSAEDELSETVQQLSLAPATFDQSSSANQQPLAEQVPAAEQQPRPRRRINIDQYTTALLRRIGFTLPNTQEQPSSSRHPSAQSHSEECESTDFPAQQRMDLSTPQPTVASCSQLSEFTGSSLPERVTVPFFQPYIPPPVRRPRFNSHPRPRDNRRCYNCHSRGHFVADCHREKKYNTVKRLKKGRNYCHGKDLAHSYKRPFDDDFGGNGFKRPRVPHLRERVIERYY